MSSRLDGLLREGRNKPEGRASLEETGHWVIDLERVILFPSLPVLLFILVTMR
jgi:hypothetical protein